jgi:hypothetical protein
MRDGENKFSKYKDLKKNQLAIASVGLAKIHAEEYDASERTNNTKTKIGELIFIFFRTGRKVQNQERELFFLFS